MSNTSDNFPRNHDTVLRYTKGNSFTFHAQYGGESEYRKRFEKFLSGNQVLFGAVKHKKDKLVTRRIRNKEEQVGRPLRDDDVLFDFDLEWKYQSDVIYVPILKGNSKEKTGFKTQKPLDLYEKFVKASSNRGDWVLDPFCGCATTPIAAERHGRRWVGIDLWDGAHEVVLTRLRSEGLVSQVSTPSPGQQILTEGEVAYTRDSPVRTDDEEVAAPALAIRPRRQLSPWQKLSHAKMREELADAQSVALGEGLVGCAGCGRRLEIEFMHLDHLRPNSDGGENWITNRVLICGPCNLTKRDGYTMRGLRTENKRTGWMKEEALSVEMQDRARKRADAIQDLM